MELELKVHESNLVNEKTEAKPKTFDILTLFLLKSQIDFRLYGMHFYVVVSS